MQNLIKDRCLKENNQSSVKAKQALNSLRQLQLDHCLHTVPSPPENLDHRLLQTQIGLYKIFLYRKQKILSNPTLSSLYFNSIAFSSAKASSLSSWQMHKMLWYYIPTVITRNKIEIPNHWASLRYIQILHVPSLIHYTDQQVLRTSSYCFGDQTQVFVAHSSTVQRFTSILRWKLC